jgi:hypothetical protein
MNRNTDETVIASVTLTERLPNRHSISATAQLVHLSGNTRPYFSVTGEIRNLRRKEDNQIETCGCIHEEIAEHFPELSPLITLHLSDDDGTPMHAAANGAYFLGFMQFKPDRTPDFEAFAQLWRITEEDARTIYHLATMHRTPIAYIEMMAAQQAERWAREAANGLALIRKLADENE